MSRRLPAALCGLVLGSIACNDDEVRVGVPHAVVTTSAPCEPEREDACLDFGLLEAGATAQGTLSFGSLNSVEVGLTGMRVEGPDVAFFEVVAPEPGPVRGGETRDVAVTFAPTWSPSEAHPWEPPREIYRAIVVFTTDDELRPEVRAILLGRASIARVLLEPEALDFGRVAVGGTAAARRVSLVNDGEIAFRLEAPPTLDAAALAAGFTFAASTNLPALEPHARTSVALSFEPAAAGLFRGFLQLDGNDPRGRLDVPLAGEGVANSAPVVCLGLVRVFDRFGRERARDATGNFQLEPSDRAVVTARPRTDGAGNATCDLDSGDPEGDPVTLRWEPLQAPDQLSTLLPYSRHVPLQPWQRELHAVVPGDYAASVVVTENNGVGLSARGAGAWRVAPRGLSLQLDWGATDGTTLGTDLDLHLVRAPLAGESFAEPRVCTGASGPDCYWSTCRLTIAGRSPLDWGAAGPDHEATPTGEQLAHDPLLEADSTGADPLVELASLARPEEGGYDVYLHFFEDRREGRPGDVPFRLTIGLADQAPRIVEGVLPAAGALYRVGTVHWTGTGSTARLDSTQAGLTTLAACAP